MSKSSPLASAGKRPTPKPTSSAEDWIGGGKSSDSVRITVDLSKDQHRRLKIASLDYKGMGASMAEIVRDLIDREFPAKD
jgi:hypothetical protein